MQAVKGRDTSLERQVAAELSKHKLRPQRCVATLPGKPDFVFVKQRVVLFVDGDFWHGWRFPVWKHKLTDYWQQKIERNRKRDRNNIRRLRRMGWQVLRLWSHEVESDLDEAIGRVLAMLRRTGAQKQRARARP